MTLTTERITKNYNIQEAKTAVMKGEYKVWSVTFWSSPRTNFFITHLFF